MNRGTSPNAIVAISLSAVFIPFCAVHASPLRDGPGAAEVINLGLRGVYFVENDGQWLDEDVFFGLQSRGLDVGFGVSGFSMHLVREDESLALTVSFPGSNEVIPVGAQPCAAKFNYFVGGEGRGVASGVSSFGEVVYEELYDGIDLHVMGSDDGVLKYEFRCEPGANWSAIRVKYDGIESLCIDNDGSLQIATKEFGVLRDGEVVVWQDEDSPIAARYELVDESTYKFAIDGDVDGSRILVIDPDVEWMYYYGGNDTDWCFGIALDAADNVFLSGSTSSFNFQGRTNNNHGGKDTFVVKLDNSGTLMWMTYLGGSGDESTPGYGTLALDSEDNVFVTGATNSTNFQGRTNSHHGEDDVFVVRLHSSGELLGMTYLGGRGNDEGTGVAIDSAGNAVVTGRTSSVDFEGRTNEYHDGLDGFVAKVTPIGQVHWMLYLGGSGEYHSGDHADAIVIDDDDSAWVAGTTDSEDFEGRSNEFKNHGSPFLLKVNSSGQLEWMYYIRAEGVVNAMTLVGQGKTILIGEFVFGGSGFVMQVDSQGEILWRTNWAGNLSNDSPYGLALDGAGNIYVAGTAESTDLEGRDNSHHGGYRDAFVGKMNATGDILWSTYLGGTDRDEGHGLALDSASNVLVSGSTTSADFEGRNNMHQGGYKDAFVLKLPVGGPQLSVTATCPDGGPILIRWSGATPDETIALIFGRSLGSFAIPMRYPCSGTVLGLGAEGLQFVGEKRSDELGGGTITGSIQQNACGRYLQLLDVATCRTSNVVQVE